MVMFRNKAFLYSVFESDSVRHRLGEKIQDKEETGSNEE